MSEHTSSVALLGLFGGGLLVYGLMKRKEGYTATDRTARTESNLALCGAAIFIVGLLLTA